MVPMLSNVSFHSPADACRNFVMSRRLSGSPTAPTEPAGTDDENVEGDPQVQAGGFMACLAVSRAPSYVLACMHVLGASLMLGLSKPLLYSES
jgi:hypothetical protein